jgi:hypothetical protein
VMISNSVAFHPKSTSYLTTRIDCTRYNANSTAKYKLYFNLLHSKIKKYSVLPTNMYNIDKKGVIIGVTSYSKQVFYPRALTALSPR